MNIDPFWKEDGNEYEHAGAMSSYPFHDMVLDQNGIVRNGRVRFKICVLKKSNNFHAALIFRKNGPKYLGVGLGGWYSRYSLFMRDSNNFSPILFESQEKIVEGQTHDFVLEFRGSVITRLELNGERLLEKLSIHDAFRSSLWSGSIGLYAFSETGVRMSVVVEEKFKPRCFVITNINDETAGRREKLRNILENKGIVVEFNDALDLSREHPLMPRIKSGITASDFVIADFGLPNPSGNVYYETGIAHSVGAPTIHLGPRSGEFEKQVKSDLKAQFFILECELEQRMPEAIEAILNAHDQSYDYLG